MGEQESTQKYELVVIVDAKLTDDEKETIIKGVNDAAAKSGAKVINSRVWLDKQKFTFDIEKKKEGTYYIINLEAPKSSAAKINPILRLNERILRFAIIKVDAHQAVEAVAA